MPQYIGLVSILVHDHDEAIQFYVQKLNFTLVEDTFQAGHNKRWVVVSPPGARETRLLLAKANNDLQRSRVGDQTGGRVFLFLYTDDVWKDFRTYKTQGVVFIQEPTSQPYGTVAVFEDLHGNQWDLIQSPASRHGE